MLRHAMSGSADWVLLYPWKTFPENICFLLCTRTTQPHRIARQHFRRPEFVDNINHIRRTGIQIEFPTKFLTTLWPFEISKKYFAKFFAEPFKNQALPSSSQILETYS